MESAPRVEVPSSDAQSNEILDWIQGRDKSPKCDWELKETTGPSWSSIVQRGTELSDSERTRAMRYIERHGGRLVCGTPARIPASIEGRAMNRAFPDSAIADPVGCGDAWQVPLDMAAMLIEEACRKSCRLSGYPHASVPGRMPEHKKGRHDIAATPSKIGNGRKR